MTIARMALGRCRFTILIGVVFLTTQAACLSPGDRARLVTEKEQQRTRSDGLERDLRECGAELQLAQRAINSLKQFGPHRAADLFAPTQIKIVRLSGGADYDGTPGDDGVTVYLRPLDRDNDVVKAPGRIAIQLLDNSNLSTPRVVGVYRFDDPDQLRSAWHGKFGTNHYTLKCPFPPGASLPPGGRLDVTATFTDYLTGAELTARAEVGFYRPGWPGG